MIENMHLALDSPPHTTLMDTLPSLIINNNEHIICKRYKKYATLCLLLGGSGTGMDWTAGLANLTTKINFQ